MSKKHAAVPALILLALLGPPAALAGPAGAGITPAVEGEGKPSIVKPADQRTVLGGKVSLKGEGAEMVTLEAKGLPAGLEAKRVSLTEWTVTGTPTVAAPAAPVTVTVENGLKTEKAETTFNWTVAGINNPGAQTGKVGAAVKVPVRGAELKTLAAVKPLPAGLELVEVSEDEWQIVGTPTKAGVVEVELTAKNAVEELLPPASFMFTVAGIIDNPGPQTGTVGVPVEVAVTGQELKGLTAGETLPAGLRLEDVEGETKWEIVGTPEKAGVSEVELKAENPMIAPVKFLWTIAEAVLPPTGTGQLTVSPPGAFAAARSTCGGVSWSPATVVTQWLLDGNPIAGGAGTTYVAPRPADGHLLSCRQTATGANGAVARQTSAGVLVHEQPPQPAWPVGQAPEHCSLPVCMEDGGSPQTPAARTYQQGGAWLAASQVRCVSAPWTSVVGTSSLAQVESFAEAHAVTVTLQRVTPAGVVTLASAELNGLAAASDQLDGAAGSPFAGQIAAGYGPQAFIAGELWPRLFPGSLGRPDRFAAGQGYLAYQLAATPGVRRSFQLVYNLTAADLGARLRCVVRAEDGPAADPTAATAASPEYAVSTSPACAPRSIGKASGPQPAVVLIGSRQCLNAPSGLAEIGGVLPDIAVASGHAAVVLECARSRGCSGRLSLAAGAGRALASARVSLRHERRRLVTLALGAKARSLLRRAGAGGLAASLGLAAHGSTSRLLSVKLVLVQ